MSLTASRRVWKDAPDTIRGGAFTLLLALADYANEHGICWPTLTALAKKARIGERQATDLLRQLEDANQLQIARKPGRNGGMLFVILTGLEGKQKVQSLHLFETEKVQFLHGKGAISAPLKVQSLHDAKTPFAASQSTETALDAQCNDHRNRSLEPYSTPNGVVAAPQATPPEPPHPAEVTQPELIGLPGTPTPPLAAAPLAPEKPAKARAPRKPKATPEQAAIRQALKTAAGWGPSAKANAQAAENGDALMAFDPAVSPERIERFARRWFPRYSPIARVAAQKGETATHPTPGQVAQFWPGFQAWEAAQERTAPPEPPRREPEREPPAETPEERRARIAQYHPFRLAPSAPVALVAAGRAT